MMDSKLLMIGDWVDSSFFGKTKVSSLKEYEGYGWVMTSGNENWRSDASLSPIPLTAEILEKNGFVPSFELGHKTLCLVNTEYSVYYRPDDTYMYVFKRDNEHGEGDFVQSDYRSRELKYVHELQRALRCCGLWDLANNFKIIYLWKRQE